MYVPRSTGGGKVRGSQEHKVVEVKQLAMYWNPQSHPLGASLEAKDNQIINVLKREEHTPGKVVYLLRPTDVTLKLLVCKLSLHLHLRVFRNQVSLVHQSTQ